MEKTLLRETYLNADQAHPEVLDVGTGRVAVQSVPSPDGAGELNEDSAGVFVVGDGQVVLALADGMGGGRSGDQASRLAIEALAGSLDGVSRNEGLALRTAILDAFERANHTVIELGVGAATTLSVVEIDGMRARPYHVGDSPIVAVGQRGRLKLQTAAHSPVGYAVRSGVLDERVAMDHDERHVISNAIGSADMHIEVGPSVDLAPFDTVLIASDGLADNLHTQEIIDIIRRGPLARSFRRLFDETLRRMQSPEPGEPSKPDDLTCLVFRPKR